MTEMSAAEAATVARFEAGVPAPESWGGGLREAIAQTLADSDASAHGTYTWGECGWELRDDYRRYADAVLALPEVATLRAKADAADRVRELLRLHAGTGTVSTVAVRITLEGDATAALRAALDGPDRTDRPPC